MAQLNFDATQVAPSQTFDPVPSGWYTCAIVESEMKPTTKGDGAYLELTFEILEGQYAKRKLFDRLNLQNANETAQRIAYEKLSAICHAVGVIQVQDSSQLHNRPLDVKASLRPAGIGGDGQHHEASNEVKGYRAQQASAPVSVAPAAGIPPAAAPAGRTGWTPPPPPAAAPAVAPAPAPTWTPPAAAPAAPAPTATPVAEGQPMPPWAQQTAAPAAPAPAAPAPTAPAAVPVAPQATPPWAKPAA